MRIQMHGAPDFDSIVRHETLVSGLSNTVFNGLIAWLLLRAGSNLTLTGDHSYAIDVMATAFLLPFIVTLIVIPLNQRKCAAGKAPSVTLDSGIWLQAVLLKFPDKLWQRALYFGLLTLLIATPLTLVPLWALGFHEFTPLAYSLFKGVWAGLMAAILTRPMLLVALQED
jgi:hypothetical protein